jgi:hypothetical protein
MFAILLMMLLTAKPIRRILLAIVGIPSYRTDCRIAFFPL